jgi:hypothetical protein
MQKFMQCYRITVSLSSSASSCSGRIRFDSCSLYPQNEIGPSISFSVVLCVFVLLVYILFYFVVYIVFYIVKEEADRHSI